MFFDDLNELTAAEMTLDSSEESEEDDVSHQWIWKKIFMKKTIVMTILYVDKKILLCARNT